LSKLRNHIQCGSHNIVSVHYSKVNFDRILYSKRQFPLSEKNAT